MRLLISFSILNQFSALGWELGGGANKAAELDKLARMARAEDMAALADAIEALKVRQFSTAATEEVAVAAGRTPLDDLALLRQELGLPEAGTAADRATTAVLYIDEETIYGINHSLAGPL